MGAQLKDGRDTVPALAGEALEVRAEAVGEASPLEGVCVEALHQAQGLELPLWTHPPGQPGLSEAPGAEAVDGLIARVFGHGAGR